MKALLHVDDSPDDRLLVQRAWEKARVAFQLKTVDGAVQAIRYLSGEMEFGDRSVFPLPDLILLDLKMPEMNGFQVLRWIRANPATRAIPVALYTGSFIPEDIAKGYAAGASLFITKPPEFSTLIEIVRAANECLAVKIPNWEPLARFSARPDNDGTES
jgi:two-component system response regulator